MSAAAFALLYLALLRWIAPSPAVIVVCLPLGLACYGVVGLAVGL